MGRPISVRIPHRLGKDEARRRIEAGFGQLKQQMAGGMAGMLAVKERWEADQLHFEGGALGQELTGRLEVLADAVQIEVDLPEILAVIADRIGARLKQEGQRLLESN